MLTYRRQSALRLFTLVFALATELAIALGAMLSGARAQTAPPAFGDRSGPMANGR